MPAPGIALAKRIAVGSNMRQRFTETAKAFGNTTTQSMPARKGCQHYGCTGLEVGVNQKIIGQSLHTTNATLATITIVEIKTITPVSGSPKGFKPCVMNVVQYGHRVALSSISFLQAGHCMLRIKSVLSPPIKESITKRPEAGFRARARCKRMTSTANGSHAESYKVALWALESSVCS